jgi:mono/diheme cytochrome c family protein
MITTLAAAAVLGLSACGFGENGIQLSESDPDYRGAELFSANCAGCHTLAAAGAEGTGNRGTRVQGPNLDQRRQTFETSLYAIQNGGYSGAIMPANIVVGDEADEVARFVAEHAGTDAGEDLVDAAAEADDSDK